MIGKLTGIIDSVFKDQVILDVNGVGYQISASARTLGRLGNIGDRVSVLIHTHVREDIIQLFGFCDKVEQDWFNLLTTVQGVGNKAGLSILSACPPERLGLTIASQDKAVLTQADGVGPKLATRILTELKDKAGDIALAQADQGQVIASQTPTKGTVGVQTKTVPIDTNTALSDDAITQQLSDDAVSALVNLGYGRSEAFGVVSTILVNNDDTSLKDAGQVIARALKELAQ